MPLSDVFKAAVTDPWAWRAASRPGVTVTPLIDGRAAFLAMEQAIARATTTAYLMGWVFAPKTRLIDAKAVKAILVGRRASAQKPEPHENPTNWKELLVAAASRGVEVKVLTADFDPFFNFRGHQWNWICYHELLAAAASVKGSGSLVPMVSPHEATKTVPAALLTARATAAITATLAIVNRPATRAGRLAQLADAPGLWPFITVNAATGVSTRSASSLTVRPATHHQKGLIVDGKIGFCGGLDIADSRAQSLAHDTGSPPWHDFDVQFDGALAADLYQNFTTRWNHEFPGFNAGVAAARSAQPTLHLVAGTPAAIATTTVTAAASSGTSTGQLIRTLTSDTSSLISWVSGDLTDVLDAYQTAIANAQQYIYIENQYVRDKRIGDWIVARWGTTPNLPVIIVLPLAPEELFSGTADAITMNGLHLQHDLLDRLTTTAASGPHPFGVYSAVRKKRSPFATKSPLPPTIAFGSEQIYVHSKLMLIDDTLAIAGSANANPRSFDIDTEACIGWLDGAAVTKFRIDLWNHMLGTPTDMGTWAASAYVSHWTSIALANKTAAPAARQGFVVPHDYTRAAVVGASLTLPPYGADELAELEEDNWVENGLPA